MAGGALFLYAGSSAFRLQASNTRWVSNTASMTQNNKGVTSGAAAGGLYVRGPMAVCQFNASVWVGNKAVAVPPSWFNTTPTTSATGGAVYLLQTGCTFTKVGPPRGQAGRRDNARAGRQAGKARPGQGRYCIRAAVGRRRLRITSFVLCPPSMLAHANGLTAVS